MQAGKDGQAKAASIEQLLAQAEEGGRSKYDKHAADIDRLRAGGVTLRAIMGWLAGQGVKAEVGEFGRWCRRREARQAKLKARQEGIEKQAGKEGVEGPAKAPTAAPAPARHAARPPAPSAPKQPVAPVQPWERRGASTAEKDLDAMLEGVTKSTRDARSPVRARLMRGEGKKE